MNQNQPVQRPLSVSELNREARNLLEVSFMQVRVAGEISNFSAPSSGHWYFSLKDDRAQVRCAMFRNRNLFVKQRPANGDAITVNARVSLYEGRGEFQLIVESMEAAGEGALRQAFEALKNKLAAEGLFAADRKKTIPRLPKRVGVITSPTGAAVRDILSVLKARFPAIEVLLFPVPVQGEEAAPAIEKALRHAADSALCDVLIVGRGGGSLEDLWAFNEERVARAIAACPLPVVSAVGHETDFTIADLVADWRAPTPSAAAEKVSPDYHDWLERFQQSRTRLELHMLRMLRQHQERVAELHGRLKHPGRRLQELAQRLDDQESRLRRGWQRLAEARQERLITLAQRLHRCHPERRISQYRETVQRSEALLRRNMLELISRKQQRLARTVAVMEGVSPLATLSRGYSITSDDDGKILRSSKGLENGSRIQTRLQKELLISRIEEIRPLPDQTDPS